MKQEIKISKRQADILDTWNNTDENILIQAVAGSGKTTTLMLILEACKYKTLFLAFNKSIQTEIQSRIDKQVLTQGKALTMHALGLQALKAQGIKFSINNNKNWDLVKVINNIYKKELRTLNREDKLRFCYTLIDYSDAARITLSDDIKTLDAFLIDIGKIPFKTKNEKLIERVWENFIKLREETYKKNIIDIDFYDMIYLPVREGYTIPVHPYYLMIDEAQDLNNLQHALVTQLLNQGAIRKWIAVGDRNQAIYGFTGASSNSFDLFKQKDNVKEMPLDICYRCPTKIIEASNEVYDVMKAFKTEEGIVGIEIDTNLIKPNSMVICRNTSPLFDLYIKLLHDGKPAYIDGTEILGYLVKFLNPYKTDTIVGCTKELTYIAKELAEDQTDEGKYKSFIFNENFKNFLKVSTLCSSMDIVETLLEKLKSIFESKVDAIKLCTIHKSKGLEADVVYILQEELIPSKFAKTPSQIVQENNLKYVARSRAKKELYYLQLKKRDLSPEISYE